MKKTQEQLLKERQDEDLAMMKEPNRWPQWPRLPVKRYVDHNLECGYLLDSNVNRTTLYIGYFFVDPPNKCQKRAYESYEAMIKDGWTVD